MHHWAPPLMEVSTNLLWDERPVPGPGVQKMATVGKFPWSQEPISLLES